MTGLLSQFLIALTFAIGFGFAIAAIIKYKAHRDNPQQITMSMVVTLVVIALAFLFLGVILYVSGETIFGPSMQIGTNYGVTDFS